MSKIQDRSFDASELEEFEAMLWREQSIDSLSPFESHLEKGEKKIGDFYPFQSMLNVEKSGIDEDVKRYQEQAKDCW